MRPTVDDPEVGGRELLRVQLGLPEPRHDPVEDAEREERVPAERARVHVPDRPVGEVRDRVHRLDRHHRPLEGRHAVVGDRDDHELQDRVVAQLVPGAAEGEEAVHHAAPGRHPEDQGEQHPERGRPFGNGRVVEVMRPRPDVDEDERPEVHDGEPVAEHRPLRRLREVVVHQAEKRRRQEERHRVVAVPPLHQRVLDARVGRVAPEPRVRHRHAVADVEDGHRDDRGDVEPDRDVEVLLAPDRDRAEEVDREGDPEHGDHDVEQPRQLGVLLALRGPGHERERRGDDEQLPAPEVHLRQDVAEEPRLQQPLHRVVGAGEDDVAAEGEDDGVGVQRPEPAEGEVRRQVQPRQEEHRRDQDAHEHADHGPHHGGQEEEPRGSIVVADGVAHRFPILRRNVKSFTYANSARGTGTYPDTLARYDSTGLRARASCLSRESRASRCSVAPVRISRILSWASAQTR